MGGFECGLLRGGVKGRVKEQMFKFRFHINHNKKVEGNDNSVVSHNSQPNILVPEILKRDRTQYSNGKQ